MPLMLLQYGDVLRGLRALDFQAFTMDRNLEARIEDPELWDVPIDARDVIFYGSIRNGKHHFRIDHDFDLAQLDMNGMDKGAVTTDQQTYQESQGTEFVILKRPGELKRQPIREYAIRHDKFQRIRKNWGQTDQYFEELSHGLFRINASLSPDEVIRYSGNIEDLTWDHIEYVHEGWLELATGKNNATQQEYLQGARLLARYVSAALENGCFDDRGMRFVLDTSEKDYTIGVWYIGITKGHSDICWSHFNGASNFLKEV